MNLGTDSSSSLFFVQMPTTRGSSTISTGRLLDICGEERGAEWVGWSHSPGSGTGTPPSPGTCQTPGLGTWLTVGRVVRKGGGSPGRSDHSAPTLFGMACGVRGGRQGGAPATHRKAEMLPIVAVQFMMPLFQSRVNHQLVTSPMVVPPLARRAGLRRGLLVVVVGGVTVLHAVNPT